MKKLRRIRGSEVSSFLMDRMAWYYQWVVGMKKKAPDGKLFFGEMFHKHQEYLYDTMDPAKADELFSEWLFDEDTSAMDPVFYRDLIDLYQGVVGNYIDYYFEKDKLSIKPIATEFKFAIPILEDGELLDFCYEGTIDLVYIENEQLKFKDYKSVSSIDRYVSNAVLDRQISRYWWALSALCQGYGYVWIEDTYETEEGISGTHGYWCPVRDTLAYKDHLQKFSGPDEFVYDIVRKDVPKPPKDLKKGGFSVDKKQNTTYELYVKTLDEAGLIEVLDDGTVDFCYEKGMPYKEIVQFLHEQGNKFLRRIQVRRGWSECESAMNDFVKAAKDMLRVRAEVENGNMDHVYWNITWDTPDFNAYYPLIQAEVKGEDVDMVKMLLYNVEAPDPADEYLELEVTE